MITPLDIENKRFAKQMMNGYNVEEVDDFLDELTEDYTKNYKEVNELSAKVEELNNSLVQYKAIESTLQDTLVMAQTMAEEVKNVAKQKADQIVEEAKAAIANRYNRTLRENFINGQINSVDAEDRQSNLETSVEEHITQQKELRQQYLQSLEDAAAASATTSAGNTATTTDTSTVN